MDTRMRREGDKVWLEGVKGWFCGYQESSVQAAQAAAMQAVGEDISYEYLLGVSGLAFRLQVHEGFCPSSPHSFCGYQCVERSVQALPWNAKGYKAYEVKPEETVKVKEIRQAVMESINRGVPVQYGREEDGVIIGYQKNGDEWLCLHPYRDGGSKIFVETEWPFGLLVFTDRKKELPSKRALAVDALKQAVEMSAVKGANAYSVPPGAKYYVGFAAWASYIQKLKDVDKEADEKVLQGLQHGNAWIYECLAQYRTAAAVYLREIAGEFAAPAAAHLRKAADFYDRMSNEKTGILRDKDHCVITIAPYPWQKDAPKWTSEMRQGQIRRLDAALPLEREALLEIEQALVLCGHS